MGVHKSTNALVEGNCASAGQRSKREEAVMPTIRVRVVRLVVGPH
jgi:hypothetical protein